jgi:sulfite reductase (ferredoxin)
MTEVKETKAQRVERFKREKNSWEHFAEIREFAQRGFDSVPPEWLGTYFRAWGIYTQGDGQGVTGGKGGEGKAVPYFMVRIRIPSGLLTSAQTRLIAALSEEHGNGVADITVRQNVQLHWVRIEALPDVLERLWAAGLSTTGACGDVTRNITGCPLAGVQAHEVADVSSVVLALDKELGGNPEFYNLPRKYKITVTGCPEWCSYPEINDIGLTATRRTNNGIPEVGFSLRVGGGLSTEPHLGVKINAFIRWEQVIPVARAITEVFRASDVLRKSRDKARLKFLFLEHGWTAETFQAALEARLGFALDPAEPEEYPREIHRDHLGVIPQKQQGLFTVGATVIRGRITPTQLRLAADLAERHGDGLLRATLMQNILLVNIPESGLETVVQQLTAGGLPIETSVFARGTVACTGSEFCKLALTETKSYARWLTEQLEERFPGYQEQIKLHITGCPNSCGQHWIADIGIEGKKIKTDGKMVDAYYFCVGGGVGRITAIARPVGYRCASDEVPAAIARLLEAYHRDRLPRDTIQKFLGRNTNNTLRAILSGDPDPVFAERDSSPGKVPHSLEDRA